MWRNSYSVAVCELYYIYGLGKSTTFSTFAIPSGDYSRTICDDVTIFFSPRSENALFQRFFQEHRFPVANKSRHAIHRVVKISLRDEVQQLGGLIGGSASSIIEKERITANRNVRQFVKNLATSEAIYRPSAPIYYFISSRLHSLVVTVQRAPTRDLDSLHPSRIYR